MNIKNGVVELKNEFDELKNELLKNLDKLHTTELGVKRIKKNLSMNSELDVVEYCKMKIKSPNASIERKGKNWYVTIDDEIITVNGSSYTIITAHKLKT
ncbi:MAG: DUF3781 domain-containing protein [Methanobacteriaceae archaeon]|nr:DUF3781 domain-containing protein [Methanobacteriaceae archaeon]